MTTDRDTSRPSDRTVLTIAATITAITGAVIAATVGGGALAIVSAAAVGALVGVVGMIAAASAG